MFHHQRILSAGCIFNVFGPIGGRLKGWLHGPTTQVTHVAAADCSSHFSHLWQPFYQKGENTGSRVGLKTLAGSLAKMLHVLCGRVCSDCADDPEIKQRRSHEQEVVRKDGQTAGLTDKRGWGAGISSRKVTTGCCLSDSCEDHQIWWKEITQAHKVEFTESELVLRI